MPSIYFRETGSGPPLILLHGFCETHEIWAEFTSGLSKALRIVTPDLPGFGRSSLPDSTFSIDEVADGIAEWMMDEEFGKSVVIGHSLGGYVALSLAARYPQLISGMGLFHSTAFADTVEKKENRNRVIDFVNKHGVQPYIDTFVPGLFFDKSHPAIPVVHGIASRTKKETLIGYLLAMRDRSERLEILAENEIPKILIAGKEDVLVPLQNSQEMAKISRNAGFYALDGVAHMGFFEDKINCQSLITRFTDSVYFRK